MKIKRPRLQAPHHRATMGHAPLAAWLHAASGADEQLQRMIRLSEGEFLLVGRTLEQFHARAQHLDGLSSAISGIMTGPEIAQAVDDLNRLIGDMENYLGETVSETSGLLAALREIIARAGVLRHSLADFLMIARTLRHMTTAAWGRHAGPADDNCDIVSLLNEAGGLSEVMASRAGALMEGLGDLEERLELTRQQCAAFEETRLARLKVMIEDTTTVLCSLTEQYGRAAVASRSVVEHSVLISRSTEEIVTSCQFHDITRQQFEKVQHALGGVSRHLSDMAARRQELPPEDEAGLLAEVGHFSLRCAEDLGTIRDCFVSAVEDITRNLGRIAEDAGTMASATRQMTEDPRSGQHSLLRIIGDGLRSVRTTLSTLAESAEVQDMMEDTVAQLTGMAAGMAGFVTAMKEITDDIENMAIHAESRASDGGPAAAGFWVFAEGLQQLGGEACSRARSVAAGLGTFTSLVEDLLGVRRAGRPRHGEWVQSMARHLDGLVTVLTRLNERIISLMAEVDAAGASLVGEIGQLTKKVRVHHMVDTAVGGIAGTLREAARAAGTPASGKGGAGGRWLPGGAFLHVNGGCGTGQRQGAGRVEFFSLDDRTT